MKKITLLIGVVCLITGTANSCDAELVSDGLRLRLKAEATNCEPLYGFLPCAPNLWGDLFLIVVYNYLLYLGASYVARGSDILFKLLGPGIFGASAFQILGSLPHTILVLATALTGGQETGQAQVVSGVAVLAGSCVFLLTLLWGTCVLVGKVDLFEDSKSPDIEAPLRFLGTGVTTDKETRYTARIMLMSTIPFIIAQTPHLLGSTSSGSVATLIALIVALTFLFSYFIYQIFQPWIQNRRLEYVSRKFVRNILLDKLLTKDGKPNRQIIHELYQKIDLNHDNFITRLELKGLILGIQFQEVGLNQQDFVEMVLKEFDVPDDAHITENEFVTGLSNWISNTEKSNEKKVVSRCKMSNKSAHQETETHQQLLTIKENTKVKDVGRRLWTYLEAASLLVPGICILIAMSTPLVNSVINFSTAINIPSMYISFIIVPMVMNYRSAVGAITSIRKKSKLSASLTLSEIYTAAFVNNVSSVTTLLATVYGAGLVWDFSAEVLVLIVICLLMGLHASFNKNFPIWTSLIAYLLYPFSILLLYVLTTVYGWV